MDKVEATRFLGSAAFLKRAMKAGMVVIARQGGRGSSTLIYFPSLLRLVERILAGDFPPLLPSELKTLSRREDKAGTTRKVRRPKLK